MPHPHDFALLNDLLDGRLAGEAALELRRRIADEPDLSAAWDDLQRMREGLKALPSPAVPAGFLDSVRSRAGLSTVQEPGAGAPSLAREPGRIFRLRPVRPWMLAAAGLGVVAGVAAWLAAGKQSEETQPGTATAARPTYRQAASSNAKETSPADEVSGSRQGEVPPPGETRPGDLGASDRRAGKGSPPDAAAPASGPSAKPLPAGAPGRFG